MDHPFVMLCLCYEFWVLKNNHQFLRHCSSESVPFLTKLNKSSLVGNELFDKSLPCIVNLTFVLALHFMKVQGQVIEFHRLDLNCFHVKQQKRWARSYSFRVWLTKLATLKMNPTCMHCLSSCTGPIYEFGKSYHWILTWSFKTLILKQLGIWTVHAYVF